jgi:hypothetical protein
MQHEAAFYQLIGSRRGACDAPTQNTGAHFAHLQFAHQFAIKESKQR